MNHATFSMGRGRSKEYTKDRYFGMSAQRQGDSRRSRSSQDEQFMNSNNKETGGKYRASSAGVQPISVEQTTYEPTPRASPPIRYLVKVFYSNGHILEARLFTIGVARKRVKCFSFIG